MKNFDEASTNPLLMEVFSIEQLRQTLSWGQIVQKVPRLPRGWYELTGLSCRDRIDLCLEVWCSSLGIKDKEAVGICRFFSTLEDIQVYVYREHKTGAYEIKMVYMVQGSHTHFYGSLPLLSLEGGSLPCLGDASYYKFFSIHNGFGRCNDEGILSYRHLARAQYKLRKHLLHFKYIDPEETCSSLGLFPFYGGEHLFTYQCFICDPELQRGQSSPNILLNIMDEKLLKNQGLRFIELSHLTATRYSSFLSWLDSYLQKKEVDYESMF